MAEKSNRNIIYNSRSPFNPFYTRLFHLQMLGNFKVHDKESVKSH